MAGQDVADAALFTQSSIERVDGGAGHAKGLGDAFLLKDVDGGFDCFHAGHGGELLGFCEFRTIGRTVRIPRLLRKAGAAHNIYSNLE